MGWDVVETLANQLHKRVLLSQLFTEWFDVVCPTLHLRASNETARIVSVWVVMREEVTREYLHEGEAVSIKIIYISMTLCVKTTVTRTSGT